MSKCPSCGGKDEQRNLGCLHQRETGETQPAHTLYRCEDCGFLYLEPPLEDRENAVARQPATKRGK